MPLVDELELETPPGRKNVNVQYFVPKGAPSSLLTEALKQKLLLDVAEIPPEANARLSFHLTTEGWRTVFAARTDDSSWMLSVWAGQTKGSGFEAGAVGSLTF